MNPMRYLTVVAVLVPLAVGSVVRADPPEAINLRKTVIVEVVQKTKDAVVNISSTKNIARRVSPIANDPFWQQFQVGRIQQVPETSLGSGFIVHADGYVVTNNHVIEGAREITVELEDGRKLPADLISADPDADLAILKISDTKPFPVLDLGDSSDLMIGEPAIAIGNPLGFSHSVSTGIVSAVHRDLKDDDDKVVLGNLVQTDAAINPGNSGGPLLNAYGQVIAINTAIRSDAQNIGFAIPVNRLRELIPELMNPAQVTKLNVGLKLSEHRTLTEPSNISCLIMTMDNPPRAVETIDGKSPKNIIDAYDLLLKATTDKQIDVTFADGKDLKITPKPVPLPDAIVQAKNRLGLSIELLTPMLAAKDHLDVTDGLLVDEVEPDSVAARAGVQRGDVIVQLDRFRITSLNDLSALIPRLPQSGRVRIGIVRGNQMGFGLMDMTPPDGKK
jgi:serine protease Do